MISLIPNLGKVMEGQLEQSERDNKVAQPLAARLQPEQQHQQRVPTGKTFDTFVAVILVGQIDETVFGEKITQLRKHITSLMYTNETFSS